MRRRVVCFFVLFFSVFSANCGGDEGESSGASTLFEVVHDDITNQLHVILHPGLPAGHTLHVQVRNGEVGFLDCAVMASSMPRIDGALVSTGDSVAEPTSAVPSDPHCENPNFFNEESCTGAGHKWITPNPVQTVSTDQSGSWQRFAGPYVDPSVYSLPFDESWLEATGPTADMIAQAQIAFHTIDICLMANGKVIRGAEMDVMRALDRAGTGKFDGYGDPNEQIASVVAYAQACVAQMGEIPFFEPLGEGDYSTYSCLDSVAIPTTVTSPDGEVFLPEEQVSTCDNPQFIYSLCEPNAVTGRTNGPRVARATNEQGTEWVLLCRKSLEAEGEYNDIAMVGTNPYTGITCFFQNGLYVKRDGLHVPHPGDEVDSTASPQQSATLWSGIQGGIGSGIECVKCHDSDPLIHTPWIDGAKDERGETVIPRMGTHDGFAQGFNEAPYTLVDEEGQGWSMPKVLRNEEAAACTKCHRIGDGRWTRSWLRRLEGEDASWNNLLTSKGKEFN
ncbi:MAG: hypothetical protein VX938_13775, partial [Myxococcota bacterium]|nr:hypothetical protein [Myxococcota bacterium]